MQDISWGVGDWDFYDCINGTISVEEECLIVCDYSECPDDHGGDDVCWIEECDDGCGFYNCSLWYEIDGEWFGEYCPEEEEPWMLPLPEFPDFRPGDVIQQIIEGGAAYEDTIRNAFEALCEDELCIQNGKNLVDLLNGRIPTVPKIPEEVTLNVTAAGDAAFKTSVTQGKELIDITVGPPFDSFLSNPQSSEWINDFAKGTK